jgi:hypothetical protein
VIHLKYRPTALASILLCSALAACEDPDSVGTGDEQLDRALSNPIRADDAVVHEIWIDVDGVPARGLVAYPRGRATQLVVCAHGMGHTADEWAPHLRRIAARGAIAVAMDYSPYFDLDRGAAETLAAARYLQRRVRTIDQTYLFSVSMGGAVAGKALAESTGVFDHWIDLEGLTNTVESWAEASAVGHRAAADLEADAGGTPTTATDAYAARSPAMRAGEIAAHGLRGVVLAHSVNDGLVPYDQARELADGLAAAGVAWDFHSVARGPCSEQGTTGTGAFGLFNPACLAGHATETSTTHPIMSTGFAVLFDSFAHEHEYAGQREYVVDEPAP